jgi:hypothetical protein
MDMANITTTSTPTTLLDVLNYTATTLMEWPLNETINNGQDNIDDTMLFVTPLALASKHIKHHHHNVHPESFSPVTLSTEWSRLTRLIFLTILSVLGSIGNIFMISSVMIEDHLKKAGE